MADLALQHVTRGKKKQIKVYVFRRDTDFRCDLCNLDPRRKETLGCNAPSKQTHIRGPKGGEVAFDTCPTHFVDRDVLDLGAAFNLAEQRVSIPDQRSMSRPYLEALQYIRIMDRARQEQELDEEKRKQEVKQQIAKLRRVK